MDWMPVPDNDNSLFDYSAYPLDQPRIFEDEFERTLLDRLHR